MLIGRIICGIAGGGVAASILFGLKDGNHVDASWTTNFTPSSKWDSNWDKREPVSLVKPLKIATPESENKFNESVCLSTPAATRHLFLIRHGQYDMNGNSDSSRGLTQLGKEQANFTGMRLKEVGFPYTKIIHSSMTRAKETAYIIHSHFPNLPMEECDMLREGTPIPPEPSLGHWRPEVNFYEDGARIEAAYRKYFHRASPNQKDDSYEIIVCHANVIRYFLCRVLQFPPEGWLRFMLLNASITSVAIKPSGRVIVYGVGESGHIPPNKLTTLL